MFGALGTLFSGISLFGKIKSWFGGGSDDSGGATLLDYEKNASRAMRNSWKDEFITIILWSPVVMMLVGALVNVAKGRSTLFDAGTSVIDLLNAVLLDGLYGTLLIITVAASFGLHINRVNKRVAVMREAAKNGRHGANPESERASPKKPASRTTRKTPAKKKAAPTRGRK